MPNGCRAFVAGVLALIPVAWLGWRWKKGNGWLLIGAGVYHLVFNLWYAVVNGKGYTFSYVIGPMELVMDGLLIALLAFGIGWLAATLGARIFQLGGAGGGVSASPWHWWCCIRWRCRFY